MAVLQDCDRSVREVCEQCGWKEDLKELLLRSSKSSAAHMVEQPVLKKKHSQPVLSASPSGSKKPKSSKGAVTNLYSTSKQKTVQQKCVDHHH